MELTVRSATAPSFLRGTAWRLRRFTAKGVTACLPHDMLIVLTLTADGGVQIDAGLLSGTGVAAVHGDVLDFGGLALSGAEATAPGALEDRVVRACLGPFLIERHDGVLTLRQDGTQLEFVPAA